MRKTILGTLTGALALVAVLLTGIPSAAAPAPITGTVIRDYAHNGDADGADPGVEGVTVTATAPDGTTATATTDANGDYTISALDDTITYRVEFSWTESYLSPAPLGDANDSSVQFVAGGDTADFALVNADDYCEIADASLSYVTTCFINGEPAAGSDYSGEPAVVSIPGTADGFKGDGDVTDEPTVIADNTEIGSTYGLAYQASNNRLFTSAFLKRHVGLGAGGIDAIYALDPDTNATSVWFSAVDAGTVADNATRGVPTSSAPANAPSVDASVFSQIYKVGWGDIDLSADESTLYGVNLGSNSVVAIDVAAVDGGDASAASATDLGRPSVTCAAGTGRLFGIEIHDGTLWAGVTCTDGATAADLSAAVVGYDLDTGAWATTPALSFPLDHAKGCQRQTDSCGYTTWEDTYSDGAFNVTGFVDTTPTDGVDDNPFNGPERPQPIISDLEIDRDGTLIIGIRDRQGDQFGHRNFTPAGDGNLITASTAGDLLQAAANGDGTWTLESAGVVGSRTSTGTGTAVTGPGGTAAPQGPGGGEFYWDDFVVAGTTEWHSEISLGALALAPGRADVGVTTYDPITGRLDAAGVSWFTNATGAATNEYELYRDNSSPAPFTSGKANGLGDLETMCPAAPVEIGNRVWFDANRNGVQDPGELPIPNVAVMLSDGQTTVTDANGNWNFTVAPNTDLTVMFDPTAADVSSLPAVDDAADLAPSTNDLGGSDVVDSDMNPADLKITVRSGAPGQNNHSLDAGFNLADGDLEIGNLVWLDNDNDGMAEDGEPGIAGVTVELWIDSDADNVKDTSIASTVTDADGHYNFTGLAAGTYYINIPAQNAAGQPLNGLRSSTPTEAAADNNNDNDDNGIDPTASDMGPMSEAVVLAANDEPTDETLRKGNTTRDISPNGLLDDNSNLSVDFGFYPLASLGDKVWFDTNANGQQEPGEGPVSDVTVELCDADMNPIAETSTDASGMYTFTDLVPGDYMVCFDLATLPPNYRPTTADVGGDAGDSDANATTGKTIVITLDPGENDPTWDLGIVSTDTAIPGATPDDGQPDTLAFSGTNSSLMLTSLAFLLSGLGVGLLALRRLFAHA